MGHVGYSFEILLLHFICSSVTFPSGIYSLLTGSRHRTRHQGAGPWDLFQREEAHWLGSGVFPEHLTDPKDVPSTLILVSFKP